MLFYYLIGNGVNTPCDVEQIMVPDSARSANSEWNDRRNRVTWALPFFMELCPLAAEEASGSPSAFPANHTRCLAFSLCSLCSC